MMQRIDPRTHMVVDLSDCSEVDGAVGVDLETNQVAVRRTTYDGNEYVLMDIPGGVKLMKRR